MIHYVLCCLFAAMFISSCVCGHLLSKYPLILSACACMFLCQQCFVSKKYLFISCILVMRVSLCLLFVYIILFNSVCMCICVSILYMWTLAKIDIHILSICLACVDVCTCAYLPPSTECVCVCLLVIVNRVPVDDLQE